MSHAAAGQPEGATLRVDVVVLTLTTDDPRDLRVLLRDDRCLPGDGLRDDEGLDDAARRILHGVGLQRPKHMEQLASFGDPDRVTDQRIVSVTYLALIPQPFAPVAGTSWGRPGAGGLAWDHDRIVATAVDRIQSKLSYSTIAFGLLPDEFTLSELQDVYEATLGTTLDKRNFRKKVRGLGVLAETGGQRRGSHRPAALHRFTSPELVLLDDVIASA